MTVSFHRYGNYFPGTGSPSEIGFGHGKYHTLNVPFNQGLNDGQFWSVFEPVMRKVMESYQPGAIVLQCGASCCCDCRHLKVSIHRHLHLFAMYSMC